MKTDRLVICPNEHDQLVATWDGERFSLISRTRWGKTKTIVMNPRQAHIAKNFINYHVPMVMSKEE